MTTLQTKYLSAACYWARDRIRCNLPILHTDFDLATRNNAVQRRKLQLEKIEKEAVDPPPKFDPNDWVNWHILFCNYLYSLKGSTNVPLYYVVRQPLRPGITLANLDHNERLIHQASTNGVAYNEDNRRVYTIMKQNLVATQAWEWMKCYDSTHDGHGAMNALRLHYDGPGAQAKRTEAAKRDIENAHYINEFTYSFEKFATKLQGAYEILRQNNEPRTEQEKVRTLLQKIKVDHAGIVAAKETVASSPLLHQNFIEAINHLSARISFYFPPTKTKIRKIGATYRNQGGNGHGRSNGNVDLNKLGNKCNGVDISNLTRNYTKKEYFSLPLNVRKLIKEKRKERLRKGQNNTGNNNDCQTIASMTIKDIEHVIEHAVASASTTQGDIPSVIADTSTANGNPPSTVSFGNSAQKRVADTVSTITRSSKKAK
jgi:hypothetical protein